MNTAAILAINLIAALNQPVETADPLSAALKPRAIIQWGKTLISKLGDPKLNRISGRLRRDQFHRGVMRLIMDRYHTDLMYSGDIAPVSFTDWRNFWDRFFARPTGGFRHLDSGIGMPTPRRD